MVETSKKLTEIATEIKELAVKQIDSKDIINMSPDEFRFAQLVMQLFDESNKLMIETAELMERIDKRIEELANK